MIFGLPCLRTMVIIFVSSSPCILIQGISPYRDENWLLGSKRSYSLCIKHRYIYVYTSLYIYMNIYIYTHIYMYTVHKEIYSCATKISLVGGLGKKCLKNLLRRDSKEKHVKKYCHKKENHYSRGTWEISGSIWGFS